MKLLNELEEDTYLTTEMIEHENNFTFDYDVWLDEDTGYKFIEKFDVHLHVLICPECNFRTSIFCWKVSREKRTGRSGN